MLLYENFKLSAGVLDLFWRCHSSNRPGWYPLAFGKWLDPEGSDLIHELIPWYDSIIGKVWKSMRWDLVGGSRPLGLSPGKMYIVPGPLMASFVFLSAVRSSCALPCLLRHDILPHHNPRNNGTGYNWLKPWKPWVKIKLSFFQLFLSGIYNSNGKASMPELFIIVLILSIIYLNI
jgi:hypothetical protein